MKAEMILVMVLPLFSMEFVVVIMTSSPADMYNMFSIIVSLKHPVTGENIANHFHVELICKRCKKKKNSEECRHMLKDFPPWKTKEKHDMVKVLYGNELTKMRNETMGVIDNEGQPLIDSIYLEQFRSQTPKKPFSFPKPRFIFVTADPSGTGKNHTAFFATARVEGGLTLVSMCFFVGSKLADGMG